MKHWPEFGKEGTTIADVMRHECGLPKLHRQLQADEVTTYSVKQNQIGKVIEETKQFWPKDQKREYHALTRDWVANEVFRRLEPQGRTMAEYMRQEIWPMLGTQAPVLGGEDNELEKYIQLEMYTGPPEKFTSFPADKAQQYREDMNQR